MELRHIESLLTPDEVAKMLRVTTYTLRKYRDSGQLPSIMIAYNCIRFDPADVRAFIELKRRKPSKAEK